MHFHFSFTYELKNNLVHFNGVETILVDYDYDQVNQILLKLRRRIITETEITLLCRIGANNRLWCNRLRELMKCWRVKKFI